MWIGSRRYCKNAPLGVNWTNCMKITGVYFSYNDLVSKARNFEDKITKARSILNMWKQRGLTMIGRIQIVKTFIISQFAYVTSAICIPEDCVNELNRLIWSFIWKGKRDRLQRKIMTRNIENGGLKAPDIRTILKVAKVKWVLKYISNNYHMWKSSFEWFLKEAGLEAKILLRSNFDLKKLDMKELPSFYMDVLDVWSQIGNTTARKENVLWYNKNITINGRSVYYKSFEELGVHFIDDLFFEDGKHIPFENWVAKGLSRTSFLVWYSLVKVTGRVMTTQFRRNILGDGDDRLMIQTHKGMIEINKYRTQLVYETLLAKNGGNDSIAPRVSSLLLDQNILWAEIFKRVFTLSIDVKTREFQYKFLHDLLPTNYWLHKWKIRDSDQCTFCHASSQTLEHLFFSCEYVIRFWQAIQQWYSQIELVAIDKEMVFLGSDDALLHTVIMTAKRYIFVVNCTENVVNCTEGVPVFRAFINNLLQIKSFEMYSVGHHGKYMEKWAKLEEIVQ